MKKIIYLLVGLFISTASFAAECDIPISVIKPEAGEKLPPAVAEKLQGRLQHLLTQTGLSAAPYESRFFLTGRFDNAFHETSGGTRQMDVINTTLTLYIGDADEHKIFASKTIDLKGVGKSEELAYVKAMSGINGQNAEIRAFINEGRDKILDYYNKNYPKYLEKARQAMTARNFGEALYYATLIPECCTGYGQAQQLAMNIYTEEINYNGSQLLSQAKGAFAADPTATGAQKAFSYINQMDPASSSYGAAMALADQMQKTVKAQWEFENIQKYKDELALRKQKMSNDAANERARIEAARAIGVAWAKNQPTTRIYYRWY